MSFGKVVASAGSNGHRDICILVVDCDPTSLMTISRMLRSLTYQVMTVGRAEDALEMTLEGEEMIDLVMTELNMPDMDGLELLDKIQRTSKLPVVIMSAEADENAMLQSLNNGAMYFMTKPVEKASLKNLWQYVFLSRREKLLRKNGQRSAVIRAESLGENEPAKYAASGLITTNRKRRYKEPATDTLETGRDEDEDEDEVEDDDEDTLTSPLRKRQKLVWTTELHNKFLFAVAELGLDNAHPKKILRIMGVEGLTKEQVSSHLQKYRLSVKRDRLAVQSVLEYATRKTTPMDYYGSSFVPYENQSLYNFAHGVRSPPTMAAQPGFAAYMHRNHAGPSNVKRGQCCWCPTIDLHGLNQRAMAINGGRPSHGWGLFNNAIMLSPRPWMLTPPPPPPQPPTSQRQGTDIEEPEAGDWFYKRNGGNQLFPK